MSWGASPDGTRSSATQVVRNRVREGCERDLSEIKLKKGEPIDRALRRLKKKVERENTLKDVRAKRTYEKPVPLSELDPATLTHLSRPDRPALLGGFLGNAEVGYVNSVIALGADYHYGKRHLLPFGEFIPPGFHWFVTAMRIPMDDQASGTHQRALAFAGQRLRPLICYEDLFGEDVVASALDHGDPAATVLVNASNLAWFGKSNAMSQHLQLSQARALETGRPMLRATNTGMTAAIDHRGELIAAAAPDTRQTLLATVQGHSGLTPYMRHGNTPVLLLCAAMLLLAGGWALWQRRSQGQAAE